MSDLVDKLESLSTDEKKESTAHPEKTPSANQTKSVTKEDKPVFNKVFTSTAALLSSEPSWAEESYSKPTKEPDTSQSKEQLKQLVDSVQSVKVQVQLADQQADVNSPLFSAHSFEDLGLSKELLDGIYAMKFSKPSKVQEKALPLLLANPPQNMIAQSQSGTGKTAAFVLTMLSRVDSSIDAPQAICLAPSRELAKQIYDVAVQMGKFTKITIADAVRESTPRKQKYTEQVVIGTPGTILELNKRSLLPFDSVKVLVFDEADVMLDKQGMGVQSLRVRKLCGPAGKGQILLFSATFSQAVEDFALKVAEKANRITLKREELSIDAIQQFYMSCTSVQHKLEVLGSIYGLLTIGSSIIFVKKRETAEKVQQFMRSEGYTTEFLHGGLQPSERDAVLESFRKGVIKVLIATNVLARGIDISQVSLVINFDMPVDVDDHPDPETYLHRIGRTGRFGRRGTAINLIHDARSLEQMRSIEKFFGKSIKELPTENLELLEEMLK